MDLGLEYYPYHSAHSKSGLPPANSTCLLTTSHGNLVLQKHIDSFPFNRSHFPEQGPSDSCFAYLESKRLVNEVELQLARYQQTMTVRQKSKNTGVPGL